MNLFYEKFLRNGNKELQFYGPFLDKQTELCCWKYNAVCWPLKFESHETDQHLRQNGVLASLRAKLGQKRRLNRGTVTPVINLTFPMGKSTCVYNNTKTHRSVLREAYWLTSIAWNM